jgi:hypothetical protein
VPDAADAQTAAFQWAITDSAVWLAVQVEDEAHVAPSAAESARSDRVDVLLTGRPWVDPPLKTERAPAVPATISMTLADNVPIARIRSVQYPQVTATAVGVEASLDVFLSRRYGQADPVVDDVAFTACRRGQQTSYELRIDRDFFKGGVPGGFDLRIADDDGDGVNHELSWCGALTDPAVFPPAPWLLAR